MKNILALLFSAAVLISVHAQESEGLWHHADLDEDSIPGVSLRQAYEYLAGRPSTKVLVAIIDSGYDTDHEAFKGKLWVNEGEIAANGKDDDGNGYVDDINGWNFIGGAGGNVVNETLELTREYRRLKPRYESARADAKSDEYSYWKMIEEDYLQESTEAIEGARGFFDRNKKVPYFYSLLSGYAKVDTLSVDVLNEINSEDSVIQEADDYLTRILGFVGGKGTIGDVLELFAGAYDFYDYQANYAYNLDFDPRDKVGDDVNNLKQKSYGNNDISEVSGFGGQHGTHVAGIVGGQSNAATWGITGNVEFMFLRTVPSGDERDKDVANSIIYAVDNGAKVINMSFGKEYSPDQDYVRKAVLYAEQKGVLMVHAAGNDGKNNDEKKSYPDGSISSKKKSNSWIEVGASSSNYNQALPAAFSNYGKQNVDLFAPGVGVMSSVPENAYEANSGTSMAAPVVAGVSALLLSYFPDLKASEVKEILMQSVTKIDLEVQKPGSEEMAPFSELSRTGGIVNAYEAVKLADKRVKLEKR